MKRNFQKAQLKYKEQKEHVKQQMNKYEWTRELDTFLMQSVVRNYFDFNVVSQELNEEAKNLSLDFVGYNFIDEGKCRIRWSYLHLQRKLGKPISYQKSESMKEASASESECNKENSNSANLAKAKKAPKKEAKKFEDQSFEQVTQKKTAKTFADIEADMWKNNLKHGKRSHSDFLDTASEDFSQNLSRDINGNVITPSTFNIFRDSLRTTSEKMQEALTQNLPDMNLKEIEESESEREGSEDEDVLPLDFRTALIEEENRVVIQAKPLEFKTADEMVDLKQEQPNFTGPHGGPSLDTYLEMVRKEEFKEGEGAVLLEPEKDVKEVFDKIMLPCQSENRINNTFNAPVRTTPLQPLDKANLPPEFREVKTDFMSSHSKKKPAASAITRKAYDTDTDNNGSDAEATKFGGKAEKVMSLKELSSAFKETAQPEGMSDPLNFENSLKEMGLGDLDSFLDTEEPSGGKDTGIVGKIMEQNRKIAEEMRERESAPVTQDAMMNDLEGIANDQEADSDVAPVSPYADALTPEEEKKLKEEETKQQFIQSVQAVSSASETDENGASGSDASETRKRKFRNPRRQRKNPQEKAKELQEQVPLEPVSEQKTKKKVQFYKGMRVMSDTEDGYQSPTRKGKKVEPIPDEESSSHSSNDSADDYFNQQRKMIKNKNPGNKAFPKVPASSIVQTDPAEFTSSDEEADDEAAKRIEAERLKQKEMIERRKAEEAERRKQEALKEKQRLEHLKEVERKKKEKEELQLKLKKQDEERKRRKKEEKERKEREFAEYQAIQEERRKKEEEIRQKELRQQKETEQRRLMEKKAKEEMERRKIEYEERIMGEKAWAAHGKTEIPCLFDQRCSYMSQLNGLPLDMEHSIRNNLVDREDVVFRRFRCLQIPLGSHLSKDAVSSLVQFFLLNSTMAASFSSSNEEKLAAFNKVRFPYKCISMQMTVTKAPFHRCRLNPFHLSDQMEDKKKDLSDGDYVRVLQVLFDSKDEPLSTIPNFRKLLKSIKLHNFIEAAHIKQIIDQLEGQMKSLAHKYANAGFQEAFPISIKSVDFTGLEFDPTDEEYQSLKDVEWATISLDHISFYSEYAKQADTMAEGQTTETWELFRRGPAFYAHNPNPLGATDLENIPSNKLADVKKKDNVSVILKEPTEEASKKGSAKVVRKHSQHAPENVCIILKDISFDPLVPNKSSNSLAYLLKKACRKEGLEMIGLRMCYLDDKQREEYHTLFHESFEMIQSWEVPVLALVFRGIDALQKLKEIVGHFNPEMARRTEQKSLRACFGRSKEENCVFKIFDQSNKKQLALKFWFGGRVKQHKFLINQTGIQAVQTYNQLHLLAPPEVEEHILLLSPCIQQKTLGTLVARFAKLGVNVNEIQKFNFKEPSDNLKDRLGGFSLTTIQNIRGKQLRSSIGYVMKLSGENLVNVIDTQTKQLRIDLDAYLQDQALDQLIFMTKNEKEYQEFSKYISEQLYHPLPEKQGEIETIDDSDLVPTIKFFDEVATDGSISHRRIKPVRTKEQEEKAQEKLYQVSTGLCFIKVSSLKKQFIGSTLEVILNLLDVEVLGLKFLKANSEIYRPHVPQSVKDLVRSVAYKFYELQSEAKLVKKINEFETIALVIRGQNLEGQISQIYETDKLKFKLSISDAFEDLPYESTPHVVFATHEQTVAPFVELVMEHKYIKLWQDLKRNFTHLNNSYEYFKDILLPMTELKSNEAQIETGDYVKLESHRDLLSGIHAVPQSLDSLYEAICVIKPNQPLNVALRVLKLVANHNPESMDAKNPHFLRISKIELVGQYHNQQIDHVFDHDLQFDSDVPSHRLKTYKQQFDALFSKKPVVQFAVQGLHSITKLKAMIGLKDPKSGHDLRSRLFGLEKESLRTFYGSDRVDNAFYTSETVHEATQDATVLFENEIIPGYTKGMQMKVVPASFDPAQISSEARPSTGAELALVVISPTLVQNNDFVYILDEFTRLKFNVCAFKKTKLTTDNLQFLFGDLCPRIHTLNVLDHEFRRGDAFLFVVEKEKAVQETAEAIGKFGIKINSDWEKKKTKKQSGFQFNYGVFKDEGGLISQYGSYIFNFPGQQQNEEKIISQFKSLPLSKHFKVVQA